MSWAPDKMGREERSENDSRYVGVSGRSSQFIHKFTCLAILHKMIA